MRNPMKIKWNFTKTILGEWFELNQYRISRPTNTIQLVIQGSHMVSGTRCPAGSDPVKKWSESRAAAPKGRCPVEHRGEFPYVLRRHISGNRWLIQAKEGIFEGWRAELRLWEWIWGLEGKFEPQRADLMLGGLVEGLEGRSEVCRSDLRRGGADLKPRRLIWGLEG